MIRRAWYGIAAALLLAGVLMLARCQRAGQPTSTTAASAPAVPGPAAREPAAPPAEAGPPVYRCPMHPSVVSDHPGECPICHMRLVRTPAAPAPAGATTSRKTMYRSTMIPGEVSDHPGNDSMGMAMVPVDIDAKTSTVPGLATVRVTEPRLRILGVTTAPVRRHTFVRILRAPARVAVDETRLHHIHTKVSGWIEMLSVTGTGEPIRKGQPLLTIYSPEILATQEEYLLALRARDRAAAATPPNASSGSEELVESARRRLLLFDLTAAQIEALDRTGIPTRTVTLFSPISGHILKRNVAHGERIDPGVALLDIADLSRVWAIASIYEYELPFVHQGQAATMTLPYLPGRSWRGHLDLVYPILDAASRTAQVRMTFDNPDLDLKPEMFAQVEIESDQGTRLAVPEEAVLSSGARDIVFVETAPGTFEPRAVTIGLRLPGSVEITAGLAEGEQVVASGNFLIDSESRLEAALQAATER